MKNYNFIKGFIIISFLGALSFMLFQVNKTYSLFETNHTSETNNDLAKWIIKINNINVSATNTFTMADINWIENQHVKNDKVAPGLSGYFDIVIDPKGTEVSVRYDITYDFTTMVNEEFYVNNIEELNENNLIRTGEFTYTGLIMLENVETTKHIIRTSMVWNNNVLNDEADSALGSIPNNVVAIPVTIKVSQYLGETIVTYTGE